MNWTGLYVSTLMPPAAQVKSVSRSYLYQYLRKYSILFLIDRKLIYRLMVCDAKGYKESQENCTHLSQT